MLDQANPNMLIPNFTRKKGSILVIIKAAKAANVIGATQYPNIHTL